MGGLETLLAVMAVTAERPVLAELAAVVADPPVHGLAQVELQYALPGVAAVAVVVQGVEQALLVGQCLQQTELLQRQRLAVPVTVYVVLAQPATVVVVVVVVVAQQAAPVAPRGQMHQQQQAEVLPAQTILVQE
jgi:hypothetical protein